MLSEFDLIKEYFQRPHHAARAVLGIGDDCALIAPTPGMQTAISSDMLVEGRHFFAGADALKLGHKALAVNLSDLAAMGARPVGFTLALALPAAERRAKAAALAPTIRGMASHDRPMVGHFTDSDVVLDFLASAKAPALAELGTSCPDHFLRTKVKPLLLDLPASASVEASIARLKELHEKYRADYTAYYEKHAVVSTGSTTGSPPMRGADPLIVLVPGVGMFSYGATKQTARVAGEFYINAINVMRGAEAISTYAPISDAEKFRIEYWALEEAKLQRMPKPKSHATRIALVTGAASGIGKARILFWQALAIIGWTTIVAVIVGSAVYAIR